MDEQEKQDEWCFAAVKEDLSKALADIRKAQGYGCIEFKLDVKKGVIVQQEVSTTMSRKVQS